MNNLYYNIKHLRRQRLCVANSGGCYVANIRFVKFSYRFLETYIFYLFDILTLQKNMFPFFSAMFLGIGVLFKKEFICDVMRLCVTYDFMDNDLFQSMK